MRWILCSVNGFIIAGFPWECTGHNTSICEQFNSFLLCHDCEDSIMKKNSKSKQRLTRMKNLKEFKNCIKNSAISQTWIMIQNKLQLCATPKWRCQKDFQGPSVSGQNRYDNPHPSPRTNSSLSEYSSDDEMNILPGNVTHHEDPKESPVRDPRPEQSEAFKRNKTRTRN